MKDKFVPKCCGCGLIVTEEVKGLQCERCPDEPGTWKCLECLDLSEQLYELLTSSEQNCLHWFCDECEKSVFSCKSSDMERLIDSVNQMCEKLANKVSESINKMTDRVSEIDERLVGMDKQLSERISIVESKLVSNTDKTPHSDGKTINVEELRAVVNMEELRAEELEIQRRQTSVIIHGLPESSAEESGKRIEDDLLQTAAMMNELNIDNVKVEQIIRLGKKPQSTEDRPRPTKLVVDSVDNKFKIIRNAKNLRLKKEGGWSKIFIHPDLTPRQREGRNKLIQEMKERLSQGEKDLAIYNGKIVKKRPLRQVLNPTSLPAST